jgi:hypothetical protein
MFAAPLVAALVAVAAVGVTMPAQADPVVYEGSIFKSKTSGIKWSQVYNSRAGKKHRSTGLKSLAVVYDWNSASNTLGTGATASFDGKKKNVQFSHSMNSMFGKKFGGKKKVTLTLFTGSGSELTVGSEEELIQALSSPTGLTKNAFEVGGTINFTLKVINAKNGKVYQQINDKFKFNPNKGLNVVGATDDGVAMFLQGKTAGGKSGTCIKGKGKQSCAWLRKNLYGKGGFKINLALTGSSGFTGGPGDGGPILDPLEEIEVTGETNNGQPGGTEGTNGSRLVAVPEPGTLGLMTLGALAAGYLRRRTRRA